MKSDKISANPISLLNTFRRNSILFGAFLVAQGLLLFTTLGTGVYRAFVVIGAILAAAGAIEFVARMFRQKKTLLNIVMIILLIAAAVAAVVMLIAMAAIPEVRVKNMMLAVSLVAIFNGLINIVQTIRIEKNGVLRAILIALAVLCIGFGVAYWATYQGAPEMLTRARGIIFIFIGVTDIWLGIRAGSQAKK